MNVILVSSIAICLGALAGAIYMVVRIKDWRLGLLAVVIALIVFQQLSHVPADPFEFSTFDFGRGENLSDLGLSLFAFLTPLFLERMIREQNRIQEALSASEGRYRSVVESIREVIFSTDAEGRWTFLNATWEAITGFSVKESLGADPLPFIHAEDRGTWQRTFDDLLHERRSEARLQVRYLTKRDKVCWLEVHAQAVRDAAGKMSEVTGVLTDVTERKRQEARIEHLAHHDALTDLPNRTSFHDRLRLATAQVKRRRTMVGILFLDLDHFKDVNDTLGHPVGDELLRAVAARLTAGLVRETDTIARLGGDEFAIIATELETHAGASALAQRIVATLAEPFDVTGHTLHIGTTVGIALYPNDGKLPDELLQKADLALYAAKEAGRGTFHFYDREIEAALQLRKGLEGELRQALERGEFVLNFQPQVELATGRIVGCEALVRWHHRERGLIAPVEFIPVAETTGLIQPLGEWVLKTACQHARAWQDDGLPPLRMAVNLSGTQFRSDLVGTVESALENSRLDPRLLELEITETIMVQGRDPEVGATLARLSEIGVVIAVDDFGTGYASLTYLRRFPVSKIKVDRSFVEGATTNPDDAEIVRAVVGLARNLNKRVVAEGVETEEQLALLAEVGCDEAQGYYFGRPVSAEDLSALVRAQHASAA